MEVSEFQAMRRSPADHSKVLGDPAAVIAPVAVVEKEHLFKGNPGLRV